MLAGSHGVDSDGSRQPVHGIAHITGGGLAENLARIVPERVQVVIDRGSWDVPAVFPWIQGLGGIDSAEMDRVFNMGIGMVLVVAPAAAGGVALAMLPFVPASRWSLGAMLFVICAIMYIPDSLVIGAAAIDFGTRRGAGTAVGVINGVGSLGAIIGGTLPGVVKQLAGGDTTPWNAIFTALAGGLIVAAACVAPQWNRMPASSRRP